MEQNPGLTLDERDRLYVWQASCRVLKEEFSEHWGQEREGDKNSGKAEDSEFLSALTLPGPSFARFAGTPRQFRDRASRYAPSDAAKRYFASVGGKLAELAKGGPVDLLGLIRGELVRGLDPGRRDIGRVILTGGSCKWPFMRDLAAEKFDVDYKRILSSPQPETTIGSGLSVYHVLKYRNGHKRLKLHEELPTYRATFEKAVSRRIDQFIQDLTGAVVDPLMVQVESVYQNWYRNGGTLNDVQARVLELTQRYNVADRLRGQDALLAKELVRLVRDHLRVWLKEHGIEREADEVVPEGSVFVPVPPLGSHAQVIARIVTETVGGTLIGAVFILVYTTAHGAHILAHPLTGIPTALVSAIASAVGFSLIEDKLREAVMAINWNEILLTPLRLRLSEQGLRDKIAASRREMSVHIAKLLRQAHAGTAVSSTAASAASAPKWQTLDQLQREVVAQFEQVVNQVIQDLGVLEEIRDAPR